MPLYYCKTQEVFGQHTVILCMLSCTLSEDEIVLSTRSISNSMHILHLYLFDLGHLSEIKWFTFRTLWSRAVPVNFGGHNLTWEIMLMEHFGCKSSGLMYMKEGMLQNSLVVRTNSLSGVRYLHSADIFSFQFAVVEAVRLESAGKSNVIEPLVGRDFLPWGYGICTCHPLDLQLVQTGQKFMMIRGRQLNGVSTLSWPPIFRFLSNLQRDPGGFIHRCWKCCLDSINQMSEKTGLWVCGCCPYLCVFFNAQCVSFSLSWGPLKCFESFEGCQSCFGTSVLYVGCHRRWFVSALVLHKESQEKGTI